MTIRSIPTGAEDSVVDDVVKKEVEGEQGTPVDEHGSSTNRNRNWGFGAGFLLFVFGSVVFGFVNILGNNNQETSTFVNETNTSYPDGWGTPPLQNSTPGFVTDPTNDTVVEADNEAPLDGEVPDGEAPDGEVSDGEAPVDGEVPDSEAPIDGEAPVDGEQEPTPSNPLVVRHERFWFFEDDADGAGDVISPWFALGNARLEQRLTGTIEGESSLWVDTPDGMDGVALQLVGLVYSDDDEQPWERTENQTAVYQFSGLIAVDQEAFVGMTPIECYYVLTLQDEDGNAFRQNLQLSRVHVVESASDLEGSYTWSYNEPNYPSMRLSVECQNLRGGGYLLDAMSVSVSW